MVVSDELVDRVVEIENENVVARLAPIAALPDNPFGVHVARFGRAVACVAKGIPSRLLSSVLGVGPEHADRLDAIDAFYAEHGVAPAIEVVPSRMSEPLGLTLAARGFAMVAFHAAMARALVPADRARRGPRDVTVERVDPSDDAAFEAWVATYVAGWDAGVEGDAAEAARARVRTWRVHRGWRFDLARIDGAPAGAAILDVRGDTALLGSAATRPAHRGRGVQRALLEARIAAAAREGCEVLAGGADVGTASMRNQLRAGLGLLFTRGIWIRSPRA